MNPRLRAAILAARAESMPKDNIARAIKKATGSDAENYDEIRYEGYGPGGVAVIVEVLTDNRNRSAGEVRASFTKSGGNLAETGAVSFMFDHVGVVEFDAKVANADAMLEAAIEAGAEDVVSGEDGHEIYTTQESLRDVAKALEAKFGEPRKAAMIWKPQNTVPVDDEQGEKVLKLIDALNEQRRRAERLRELRGLGRAGREDERVTVTLRWRRACGEPRRATACDHPSRPGFAGRLRMTAALPQPPVPQRQADDRRYHDDRISGAAVRDLGGAVKPARADPHRRDERHAEQDRERDHIGREDALHDVGDAGDEIASAGRTPSGWRAP